MRVLIVNADEGGCGFYRLIAPSNALAEEPDLVIDFDRQGQSIMAVENPKWDRSPTSPVIKSVMPVDYDVVVFQRPLSKHEVDAIPHIRAAGSAVVVEFDDDFWHVDRRNVAHIDDKRSPYRNAGFLAQACGLADIVTVSTPRLAAIAPCAPDRVRVLRNCIPKSYLSATANPDAQWSMFEGKTVVGWTGSPRTHPGDLQQMGDALVRAVRQNDAVFFAIGSPDTGALCGFNPGESAFTQWILLYRYPEAVAGLDIGVVPLSLSPFNEAKSWLKGLEYAALGVPFVASPTSEYELLAEQGAGLLARYPHDWHRQLTQLLAVPDFRATKGGEARAVAERWTYERHAARWAEAWADAIKIRAKEGARL
jgi:hypothetical protein